MDFLGLGMASVVSCVGKRLVARCGRRGRVDASEGEGIEEDEGELEDIWTMGLDVDNKQSLGALDPELVGCVNKVHDGMDSANIG